MKAVFALASLQFVSIVVAQQHPAMPAGMTHEQHLAQIKKEAEMKQHGLMAMGFDQDKATHHFTLTANGGMIVLSANERPTRRPAIRFDRTFRRSRRRLARASSRSR